MSDSLFDLASPAPSIPVEKLIRDDQVQQIREAFVDADMKGQEERKAFVESVVLREVGSLRDLTAIEAHRVLTRIKGRSSTEQKSTGSAWDNREEDTWIDKM